MATVCPPTEKSWFVSDMVKATSDMWLKGWDERNGGNVTLRLLDEDVAPYLGAWTQHRVVKFTTPMPELGGQYYLATGSGKYFRNVQIDPAGNLCIFRVLPDGSAYEILWGLEDGGLPTSELPSHLQSHAVRQRVTGKPRSVIMHCHATNLISLGYVLQFDIANVTRALWEGSTECLVVFPDGVGTVEWMVPGTDAIGDATAALMAVHSMVLWQYHGVFGTGQSLDEAFGLIDTAEKSAEVLVKVISMGGVRQTITAENFVALAKRFDVTPYAPALAIDHWRLAASKIV